MDECEMIFDKKIPTDLWGELTIKAYVMIYDYPRVFIAESKEKNYYAFLENADEPEHFGWDVSKVNLDQINDVNTGKSDFQSLFKGDDKELFLAEGTDKSDVVSIKRVTAFTRENAVCDSLFLPDFCDMDEAFSDDDSAIADEAYADYVKGGKKSHTAKEVDRKYGIEK